MTRLHVQRAGPLLTVQDLGRPGYAHLGVPRSGAADRAALVRANRRVGNPDGAAALEATLLGALLVAEADLLVGLAGACGERTVGLAAGERLSLPNPATGVRSYVAPAGGVRADPVLGSRSWDVLGRLGPRPLRDGDEVDVGDLRGEGLAADPVPARCEALTPVAGPGAGWLDTSALPVPYEVLPASSRIGVRLSGPVLPWVHRGEPRTLPLVRGAVQVPPDGQPVVMLADHPTTGGYPVLGVLPEVQMATVAQLRPGDRVVLGPLLP